MTLEQFCRNHTVAFNRREIFEKYTRHSVFYPGNGFVVAHCMRCDELVMCRRNRNYRIMQPRKDLGICL